MKIFYFCILWYLAGWLSCGIIALGDFIFDKHVIIWKSDLRKAAIWSLAGLIVFIIILVVFVMEGISRIFKSELKNDKILFERFKK